MRDEDGIKLAIAAAKRAALCGLRPFGSVIVGPGDEVIGQSAGSETPSNPTRHSELLAIKAACFHRNGLLHGCTLYQTHECCMGCCGFVLHSKISRVVVGSMRADLPQLFRQRHLSMRELLSDTSRPPVVVELVGPLRHECIALFARELMDLEERQLHVLEGGDAQLANQ